MNTYIVKRRSDGVEVYRYDHFEPLVLNELPGEEYEHVQLVSAPAPAPTSQPIRITRLAFRNRFTKTEKASIEIAAQHNPSLAQNHPANLLAADLRASMADQRDALHIDLSRPDTRAGVLALEQFGILAQGRALTILDTPPTDSEAFNG